MVRVIVTAAAIFATACGAAQNQSVNAPDGPRGVRAAALPFKILRAHGGQEISTETFVGEIEAAQGICIGETHTNPHHHWAQLHILEELRASGGNFALGMEMFQQPFQGVLDDFSTGKISESELLSRSGWKERWGYDWSLYSPMVMLARERGAVLLALNVSRELTKKVAKKGLAGLTSEEKAGLPELRLDDADHRAWWAEIMGGMGGAEGHSKKKKKKKDDVHEHEHGDEHVHEHAGENEHVHEHEHGDEHVHGDEHEHGDEHVPDRSVVHDGESLGPPELDGKVHGDASDFIYTAQVLWDESMAERAAEWLKPAVSRQIVILAGNGHCHESAIVRRMKRRGVDRVVSVRPIIDDGDEELSNLLAAPENDYLFVMSMAKAK